MNNQNHDAMLDLLTRKAIYGLDEDETRELDSFDGGLAEREFMSLEITAAAITMAGLTKEEPLPAHLHARILDDADRFVSDGQTAAAPWPPPASEPIAAAEPVPAGSSWFGWLGWAAAAAACLALAVNMWFTRSQPPQEIAVVAPPVERPQALTPAQMRDAMMSSSVEMVRADWAAGNVKDMKQVSGDVVWSDEKQAGYMRLRGLPANDETKETYQLWIFDKTQDKATPIDGGTFDVSTDGEVIIPINAKLTADDPEMFAITIEKPGGVVVSKREKIAALAKVG